MQNERAKAVQDIMKAYANHFTLEWHDDVSDWEGEIPTPVGGGAFLPSSMHAPPDLFMTFDDVMNDGKEGPWVFISYRNEENSPHGMSMDTVTTEKLLEAITKNDPIHDPMRTFWAEAEGKA